MKKNKLFIFLFVFIMFFCVNVGNILALNEKGAGGASGASYSFGIKCFYYGEIKSNSSYNPTASGSIGSENTTVTPFVYGIDFYCSGEKCKSFDAWGHGKAAHRNAGKYTIVGPNNYNALFMKGVDNNTNNRKTVYSYFGTKLGEGVSKCPSKLYYDEDKALIGSASTLTNTSSDGSKIGDWWYASERGIFKYPQSFSLLSSERYKKGNGGDLMQDVENLVKDFKEITTDASGNKYDTTDGAVGSKISENTNEKLVESIKKWAEERKNLQKDANVGIDENDELDCSQVLGDAFADVLADIFTLTCVIGVVLLIFTLIFDFIKAITSGEDGALLDVFKKAKNRVIATIILLLLPILVNFIINFLNNNLIVEDGNIKIGNVSECKVVKD